MTHGRFDVDEEASRWLNAGLPHEMLVAAADHLLRAAIEARDEEERLVTALRRELVYSLCWPEEVGQESLVSRAYLLMGQSRFPTPGDPEPVRQSLHAHEERLQALRDLVEDVQALKGRIMEAR